MYCKVSECDCPYTHVTLGHKCNKCKRYGHGEIECNNLDYLNYLKNFNKELPTSIQCKFGGCRYYKYHTNDYHFCQLCLEKYHSQDSCELLLHETLDIICPICKKINIISCKQIKIYGLSENCVICMDNPIEMYLPSCGHACLCISCTNKIDKNNNPNIYNDIRNEYVLIKQNYNLEEIRKCFKSYPSYVYVYEGNGCYSIIRIKINRKIEGLFINTDDINNISKIIKKSNFIKGYALVNTDLPIYHNWLSNLSY